MSSLTTAERTLYEHLWAAVPKYADHAPGERVLPLFLQTVGTQRGHVLDAGTGSGKGALALQDAGFRVTCCDVTDAGLVPDAKALPFYQACLWTNLRPLTPAGAFDWVYCTDVLEHVPPQFTMLAIHHMLQVARRGLFLSVSLVPDQFGVWAGKALHQTVQPFVWWKDSLGEVGHVTEARDLITTAIFYVEPSWRPS